MPAIAPFILQNPKIIIDPVGAGTTIDLACSASEIHTNVSQDSNTVDTFCGSYTSYKPQVWDVTLTAYQSFGTAGLEAQMRPLVGVTVGFQIWPSGAAASVDNPVMSGLAIVQAYPFLDGAVGEASSFDFVLAVQGQPTFGITTPTPAMVEGLAADEETAPVDAMA